MKLYSIALLLALVSCDHEKSGVFCERSDSTIVCKTYHQKTLVKLQFFEDSNAKVKSGPCYEFAPNGDTLINSYYAYGRLLGSYYEYFGGHKPKKYVCFDSFHEDTMFYREYDPEGAIVKESGELLYGQGYTSCDTQKLISQGVVSTLSVLVSPPRTSILVNVYAVNKMHVTDTVRHYRN